MASKKTKAPATDDNIDDLFSGIPGSKPKKPSATTSKTSSKSAPRTPKNNNDILADIESELASQEPASRSNTPRLSKEVRRSTATPPVLDGSRKSTDSTRSFKNSFTPSATSSSDHPHHESEKKTVADQAQPSASSGGGGGWWGSIISTATATAGAAMKQAGAAYEQIQQNEEAKRWAEQVKGISENIHVDALRSYGDELRQRAIPTFTNILHTLAPPISSHERLLIHIAHDFVGYPSLDPLIHAVFARVMSQVEGGDLLVVQRGHENSSKRAHDSSAGWRDGPWWRQAETSRELSVVKGLVEGTKLCRAGAESYATEYFASHGGVAQARTRATEAVSESNPVRTSNIFLCIQAIALDADRNLFAGSASAEKEKASSAAADHAEDELVCFAIYMLDPIHEIEYSTLSQTVPARWIRWLDAASPSPLTPSSSDADADADTEDAPRHSLEFDTLPDEIREIIESGGVDPREWVAEWIEEMLNLSVGIVAQRYVARRMGLGEGALGKGKKRMEELVEDGGGEVARAGIL